MSTPITVAASGSCAGREGGGGGTAGAEGGDVGHEPGDGSDHLEALVVGVAERTLRDASADGRPLADGERERSPDGMAVGGHGAPSDHVASAIELGVDEGAFALVRAEVADRVGVVPRGERKVDGRIESDEGAFATLKHDAACFEGRAECSSLARMWMHMDDGIGHAFEDVIVLRFDSGEVVLRAALQHEGAAQRGHARDLRDILPDILRQHEREACEQFFA